MLSRRATELVEEAQRQVALHAPSQLPTCQPALEPRLPRCLQPLLHLLDHVPRRRPAEPSHQRQRQGIVVLDAPDRLPVVDYAPSRRVRQRKREGLLALIVRVVQDRHLDGLRPLARRKGQRPAHGRIVRACPCAAVHGGVVDADRLVRRPVQDHREIDRVVDVFRGLGIRNREP